MLKTNKLSRSLASGIRLTLRKKSIFILIAIIILNVVVVLGQTDNQISLRVPAIEDWNLESNIQVSNYITQILRDDSAINKFREQFNALDDSKKLLIWNGITIDPPIYDDSGKKIPYATHKKFLREAVFKDEETTKSFLGALDSSSNVNDEYKFLSSVIKEDDELIKQTFKAFDSEPNKIEERYRKLWDSLYNQDKDEIDIESRNKIVGLLNKEQFQTLMKTVTGKTIELLVDFGEKAFGYELKDGNPVWTLKKDDKTYFISEKNLPDNLEKIIFKEIVEGPKKGQYGVFYKTAEVFTGGGVKGNTIMTQEGYLQKSENKNEWKVSGLNKEIFEGGKVVVGLDPKQGQVEIASDGKIETWGTGHLSGKEGIYVKIGEQRFFPHPKGPQTADKLYRYAFVAPLEKDVFNLKGNMQAKVNGKGIGVYVSDIENGVVSLGELSQETINKYNADPNNKFKIDPNSVLTLSPGGLDIKGTTLNGKVSFSVSDDMKLTTSKDTFDIEPKDSNDRYYSYNPTAKGELNQFVERDGKLEFVKRITENTQFTDNERRVGIGQTADGTTPTHISDKVENALEEANKISTEKGNWATATEKDVTEEATKINEKVSTEEKSTTDLITNKGEVVIESVEDKETITTNVPNAETRSTEQIQLLPIKILPDIFYNNGNLRGNPISGFDSLGKITSDNKVVAIKFGFDGCPGCDAMKRDITQSSIQGYPYVDVDIYKYPDLVTRYSTSRYPTTIFLKDGKEVGREVGYQSSTKMKELYNKYK